MIAFVQRAVGAFIMASFAYYGYTHPQQVGRPWKFPIPVVRAVMMAIMVIVIAAFTLSLVTNPPR